MKKKLFCICAYTLACLISYAAIFSTVAWLVFGYYAKEKIFKKEGCVITLTNDFTECDKEQYTAYYYSGELIITTLKVPFEVFTPEWNAENKSAVEYAELMQIEYGKIYPTSELYQDNGLLYFIFDYAVNAKRTDKYLVSIYKSDDAFWQVSFGCKEGNYKNLREFIIKYGKSVCLEETVK